MFVIIIKFLLGPIEQGTLMPFIPKPLFPMNFYGLEILNNFFIFNVSKIMPHRMELPPLTKDIC